MAYSEDRPQRQMYPLNPPQPCSLCGKPISQVPFEPDPARFSQLKCFDCYKAQKGGGFNR